MHLAYLLTSDSEYLEVAALIDSLIVEDDQVFVIHNNPKVMDRLRIYYGNHPEVHLYPAQDFALTGDLSLARGTLVMLREALESTFDYVINLTDGMAPIKPRDQLVSYLEEHPQDHYLIYSDEHKDPSLRKKYERYYPFTNLSYFQHEGFTRLLSKGLASIIHLFKKRNFPYTYVITSPWFVLSRATARLLVEHFGFLSQNFMLFWYPEEVWLGTMLEMLNHHEHINNDLRWLYPDGDFYPGISPAKGSQQPTGARPVFFAAKRSSE